MATACSATECGEYLHRGSQGQRGPADVPAWPSTPSTSRTVCHSGILAGSCISYKPLLNPCRTRVLHGCTWQRGARGHARDADAHPGCRLQVHLVKPRAPHRLRSTPCAPLAPPFAACCPQMAPMGQNEQAAAQSIRVRVQGAAAHQEAHASLRQALQDSVAGNIVDEQARCGGKFVSISCRLRPTSLTEHGHSSGHTCLRHSRLPAALCLRPEQPACTYVRTLMAARAHSKSLRVSVATRAPQRTRCPEK